MRRRLAIGLVAFLVAAIAAAIAVLVGPWGGLDRDDDALDDETW